MLEDDRLYAPTRKVTRIHERRNAPLLGLPECHDLDALEDRPRRDIRDEAEHLGRFEARQRGSLS